MKKTKKQKLEAAGWRVGTAEEFLGLSREEAAFVDLRGNEARPGRQRPAATPGKTPQTDAARQADRV